MLQFESLALTGVVPALNVIENVSSRFGLRPVLTARYRRFSHHGLDGSFESCGSGVVYCLESSRNTTDGCVP